jgi:hypothetical protein
LKGSGVVTGRDLSSTTTQWNSPVAGVSPYLLTMTKAYDSTASTGMGATAALPTTGVTTTVNNLVYTQNWYVGTCYQPDGGGACGTTNLTGYVSYYRVVVAVTWTDKICASSQCSFVTSSLISNASSEPLFNSNLTSQAPTITNPGDQTSDAGVLDSLQLISSGGAGVITWGGSQLPPGLTISAGGLISGTPTTVGAYSLTVTATDTFGLIGSAVFNWTVNAALTITQPSTQTDALTEAASFIAASTGGTGGLTWTATGLPAGITLNKTSGTMSGTPTAIGTSPVTLSATDSLGQVSAVTFSWVINAKLSITTPAAQNSFVGIGITALQVVAANGAPPYSWTAKNLPSGLSIGSSGQITGTPSGAGTFSPTVTVTDADSGTATTSTFTWKVTVPVNITSPLTDQASTQGRAITAITATATGGTSPYTWKTTSTGLPTGVAITSGGVISGTPSSAGSYPVTLTVTDSTGQTDSQSFNWVVNAPVTVTGPSTTQTSTKGRAIVSIQASTSGGTGTITWKTTSTGLPAGISINSSGVISGTPTGTGTSSVTLTATDSLGSSDTQTFSWTVNAVVAITAPTASQKSDKGVTITPITATATGGTGTISWSATGLPTGITIDPSTGVISGTASTTTGSPWSVVITATDSLGATDTQALTWTINSAPTVAAIATQTTVHSHAATAVTPVGSAGTTAYTWTVTGLPSGITINASTGKMSGTPTTVGTYTVKVTLTDAAGGTASTTFTWNVT